MKRKVRMKRFKIGFSLLMSFVMVLGVLQYALTAKQQPVQAAAEITTSNYKTWTAPTLAEARDAVNKLLSPIKGSDTSRPYKENRTWQEGSLAALDKVYFATVSTDSGVSSELARQQLIQTVRGLELYDSSAINARNLAINDYSDDNLTYDLAHIMSDIESGWLPGAFSSTLHFTDYANTMGSKIPTMTTTNTVNYVRQSLIQQYDSMVVPYGTEGLNIQGYYSGSVSSSTLYTKNQGRSGNMSGPDAGLSTGTNGWIVSSWFNASNPTTANTGNSDPAKYVEFANKILNNTDIQGTYAYNTQKNTTPVLILYSNYEFTTEDQKKNFLKSLEAYEDDPKIQNLTNTAPIFIQVSFKRDDAANYDPMVDKIFTPDRVAKGWKHIEVNSTNANSPSDLTTRILDTNVNPTRVRGGVLSYPGREVIPLTELNQNTPWNTTLSTNQFNFVLDSFGGKYSIEESMTANELKFKGTVGGGLSAFQMTAANNNYTGYKMGDKVPAYNSTSLTINSGTGKYNESPNLYVPLSDAAVELYTYNGSGSESVASNYTLKNTVVSNTYDHYGGTTVKDYTLKSDQLASKKYGTVLSQNDLKNAVKGAMGDAAFNSLDFTNSNSLNTSSLTVSFDASKNVYKLYAKEAPTQSKITIEHWLKDGGKISSEPDRSLTGDIGEPANITPTVIPGYTYVNSDSDPLSSVTFGSTDKTVKLYYTENPKTSTITIEHWISGGGKITTQSDISKPGTSGEPANITPTVIPGYTYVNSDSDPLSSVTFGDTNKTVKLYYTENPKEGTVTIEYWDSDTNTKITSQSDLVLKGEIGNDVNYTQKDIAGYSFDKDRSDTVPSKFTDGSVTVRQYYSKVYTVTIEYWDSGTNSKITTEANTVITGKKDAALSYSPKEIEGYIYDSVRSDNIPTTITGDATYRAYYNKAGAVTIEYWSSDTNQKIIGQSDEVLKGILDTKATITPKVISGYKFDASRSDSLDNVTYKTGSNTIRLYYTQYVNLTVIFEKVSPKQELGKVVVKAKMGDTVHLENDFSDVKTKLTELENSYRLYKRPTDYAAYKVPTDDATVTYLFDGTLFLSSAPSLLEFGSGHKIMQLGEYESELPTYDKPLTVTDTRATLTNWTISVKLTEDMHSRKKPSFILKDVLYYKEGSKMTPVTSSGPLDIVTSKHNDRGDYDVSETEWKNKSNGFIFKLGKNQYRDIDDYDGTLEFTLTEAP